MRKILRGNFQTRNPVDPQQQEEKTLEEQFEHAALKRLGGSIAFVSKKKVSWDLNDGKKRKGDE